MDRTIEDIPPLPTKRELKGFYYDFFKDFREYLNDYIRETVTELRVTEIPVVGSTQLFDGSKHGKVRIQNQGETTCYISTTGQGGYKLKPDEPVEFYVNRRVVAQTVSGNTTVGIIWY